MHIGKFVFAQIAQFLPQRQFRRIVVKYDDRTQGWSMSHWNHLLILMFGQLMGCGSLRELTDITIAHGKKSKFLGFGHQPVNRQMLSKASTLRDYRIFEEFAFHMVANTRHSSGIGVNAKNINSIEPDECPDDSSGTRQALIRVVLAVYQEITGKPDE